MNTLITATIDKINKLYGTRFTEIFNEVHYLYDNEFDYIACHNKTGVIYYGDKLVANQDNCFIGLLFTVLMIEGKYGEHPLAGGDKETHQAWNIATQLNIMNDIKQLGWGNIIPEICINEDMFDFQLDYDAMTVEEIYDRVLPEISKKCQGA